MSSEFLMLVKNRRSIRRYLPKRIPEKIIRSVLEAGRWAPSAHNAQPWRFIIVSNQKLRRKLADAMAKEWAKDLTEDHVAPDISKCLVKDSVKRFVHAPVLIVASVTMEDMDSYPDERRRKNEHTLAIQSLAAAVQNMLLAAHSAGLGSCWFCAPLFCQDVVRKVLSIPGHVEPQALITLGYPSERPSLPSRKPLKEVVFEDCWGEKL